MVRHVFSTVVILVLFGMLSPAIFVSSHPHLYGTNECYKFNQIFDNCIGNEVRIEVRELYYMMYLQYWYHVENQFKQICHICAEQTRNGFGYDCEITHKLCPFERLRIW